MTINQHSYGGHPRARRLLLALPLAVPVVLACQDSPTQTAVDEAATAPDQLVAQANASDVNAQGTIALPINQTTSTAAPNPAFGVKQTGTGPDGVFTINNSSNASDALAGMTNGKGRAANFSITNATNSKPAVNTQTNGTGVALKALTTGSGSAGLFTINKTGSPAAALSVNTNGIGVGVDVKTTAFNAAEGVHIETHGTGINVSTDGDFNAIFATATGGRNAIQASATGFGFAVAGVAGGTDGRAGFFFTPSTSNGLETVQVRNDGTGFAIDVDATEGSASAKGVRISTNTGQPALQVLGGTKNAVVATTTGARALYTEESTEVWFTDYGFGRLVNGRARILLDPTFAQTVEVDEPYHVFLEEYGDAELYVRERTSLGFEVAVHDGDPNAEFSYRVVLRRKGYAHQRLERAPWADNNVRKAPLEQ